MARLSDLNLLSIGHTIQLAGAVYIGEGKVYLAMLPDESGDLSREASFQSQAQGELPVETLTMDQDDWAKFLRQTDLLETEALVRATNGTIEKAIVRKSQRQVEQGVSWKVYKRDGYRCRYCGSDDVPLTVDHLVCWEQGGPSIVENLVSSCRKCNKTRGNLLYKDWLQHPFYLKVSVNLSDAVKQSNLKLLETLDTIPLTLKPRTR